MKKYQQLFKLIEQDILSEKYPVGEFLPSENELTQIYKVSRDTVRKVTRATSKEGLIQKFRDKDQNHQTGTHQFSNLQSD